MLRRNQDKRNYFYNPSDRNSSHKLNKKYHDYISEQTEVTKHHLNRQDLL